MCRRLRHDVDPGRVPRRRSGALTGHRSRRWRFAAANSSLVRIPSAWRRPRVARRSAMEASRGRLVTPRRRHPRAAPTDSVSHRRPEGVDPGSVVGFGHPARPERRRGDTHRRDRRDVLRPDVHAVPADRASQVLVRAIGHDRHEVEADPLRRVDLVEHHVVVAVRAADGHPLAPVLTGPSFPSKDHDHAGPPIHEPSGSFAATGSTRAPIVAAREAARPPWASPRLARARRGVGCPLLVPSSRQHRHQGDDGDPGEPASDHVARVMDAERDPRQADEGNK